MLPSFHDINYFLEVAETKNISRAAERLGITQPSLSSAIKRLEDSFGTQLLIRSRSGVQLTKAGEELFAKGRLLILNWEQLRTEINRRESSVSGQYIIGCHTSVALCTLPQFIPKLLIQNPDLEIKLLHDLSRKVTETVISYKADFGIVVNPVKHPDLVIREICTDEVSFWKARKNSPNQDLRSDQKVLVCDPNLTQTQKLIADLEKKKIHFKRQIHSSSLEVITDLTLQGAGIGILPKRVATRYPFFDIELVDKRLPHFKDRICLIYRGDAQRTKGHAIIAKAIRNERLVKS